MRKVYEKIFPTREHATSFLEGAGWRYVGRYGLLRKFDVYEGLTITKYGVFDDEVRVNRFEVRLSADGHAALFVPNSDSLLGTTNLPEQVWASFDAWSIWMNEQETEELERLK